MVHPQQKLGPDVITREVVSKFYLWKRTTKFKRWRQQQKSKKKKESASLRLWGGEADAASDALAGYHNEHCELCSTGGKLLCCDGCARAYHFSCVQPPITDVPEDDWFCPRCRDKMGGATPKLMPSEENEYCLVYAPVSVMNCPDELHEAISDASSYEAEGGKDGVGGDEDVGEGGDASNELPAGSEQDDGSDYPSTEELSSGAGNSGSLTDNDESDGSGAKFLSLSPDHSDQTPVRRPKQQRAGIATHSGGAYLSSTKRSLEYCSGVPSPSGGRRMVPLQQERLPSSRKRQRKTVAPRRIPPSHLGN
ncbi:hypothetical protein BBJ28_00012012 [Nothophytophthora sp. Chile5]|nr:hypothetical protein BBJ28_00012012 [Nothophytophthora sp. Chile5]